MAKNKKEGKGKGKGKGGEKRVGGVGGGIEKKTKPKKKEKKEKKGKKEGEKYRPTLVLGKKVKSLRKKKKEKEKKERKAKRIEGAKKEKRFADKRKARDETKQMITAIKNSANSSLVDGDTREYFLNLRKTLRGGEIAPDQEFVRDAPLKGFSNADKDSQDAMVINAFKETRGKEWILATDSRCSLCLEDLFRATGISTSELEFPYVSYVVEFLSVLKGNYFELAFNVFGSRVLETVIGCFHQLLSSGVHAEINKIENFVLEFCRELDQHWPQLVLDQNASFVVRILFKFLGGCKSIREIKPTFDKSGNNFFKKHSAHLLMLNTMETPFSFQTALNHIITVITQTDRTELSNWCFHSNASPVLAALLSVIVDKKASTTLIKNLLMFPEDDSEESRNQFTKHLSALMVNNIGSVVLEQIIRVANDAIINAILESKCIATNLVEMSKHFIANFIVQRLIERCPNDKLQAITQTLAENMFVLMDRPGVILKLADIGTAKKENQQMIFNALTEHLNHDLPMFMAVLLLRGKKTIIRSKAKGIKEFSIIGSLLVQQLFEYDYNIIKPLVQSITRLTRESAFGAAVNANASRALESFFRGPFPTETKSKLVKILNGKYLDLAKDSRASHVLEAAFEYCPIDIKEQIAEELVVELKDLTKERYGAFAVTKFKLFQFAQQKSYWLQEFESKSRKQKLFNDILDEEEKKEKKPKHDKKSNTQGDSKKDIVLRTKRPNISKHVKYEEE